LETCIKSSNKISKFTAIFYRWSEEENFKLLKDKKEFASYILKILIKIKSVGIVRMVMLQSKKGKRKENYKTVLDVREQQSK
jgi:hypothetical protein